ELGVAGVPALVLLPLNRPELIPLEGAGHWLGLVPLVGRYLKRYAVRLFVEGLAVPVSLPNRITGEDLMVEVAGRVHPDAVAERALALVTDAEDLERRRLRLRATMPRPGAAAELVRVAAAHAGLGAASGPSPLPPPLPRSGRSYGTRPPPAGSCGRRGGAPCSARWRPWPARWRAWPSCRCSSRRCSMRRSPTPPRCRACSPSPAPGCSPAAWPCGPRTRSSAGPRRCRPPTPGERPTRTYWRDRRARCPARAARWPAA